MDTIVQTNAEIVFSAPVEDKADAERTLDGLGVSWTARDDLGKVSLVGAGMKSHPGVTATFCEALSEAGINIELISTSEIRISVLCRDTELDDAVRALHSAFELGGDEVATVHGGTGR